MLRYKTETRPGLVALYDIRPGNGAGQFLQPRSPHGASLRVLCQFDCKLSLCSLLNLMSRYDGSQTENVIFISFLVFMLSTRTSKQECWHYRMVL